MALEIGDEKFEWDFSSSTTSADESSSDQNQPGPGRDGDSTDADVFSREEIESMFAKLRVDELQGMEADLYPAAAATSARTLESDLAEVDQEEPRIIGRDQIKLSAGASAADGLKHETIYTTFKPEQYRLCYIPWITKVPVQCDGQLTGNQQQQRSKYKSLAQIEQELVFKKKNNLAGDVFYTSWIEIRNNCTRNLISYNIKEFNSDIFKVKCPLGILMPKESRPILIKTLPDLNFGQVMEEAVKVYVAPCEILDLFGRSSNSGLDPSFSGAVTNDEDGSKDVGTGTGDAMDLDYGEDDGKKMKEEDSEQRGLYLDRVIREEHLVDFWTAYGSPWFPHAEIHEINELRPACIKWVQPASWWVKSTRFVGKVFSGLAAMCNVLEYEFKRTICHQESPFSNPWQKLFPAPKDPSKAKLIFGQAAGNEILRKKIVQFAVCSSLLFMMAFAKESPFRQLTAQQQESSAPPPVEEQQDDGPSGWLTWFIRDWTSVIFGGR